MSSIIVTMPIAERKTTAALTPVRTGGDLDRAERWTRRFDCRGVGRLAVWLGHREEAPRGRRRQRRTPCLARSHRGTPARRYDAPRVGSPRRIPVSRLAGLLRCTDVMKTTSRSQGVGGPDIRGGAGAAPRTPAWMSRPRDWLAAPHGRLRCPSGRWSRSLRAIRPCRRALWVRARWPRR
jgi:hypothetical protein